MANYAYVENEQILGIYDDWPQNWKNISNFQVFANDYPDQLNSIGWYILQKITPQYDPETQKLGDYFHYYENNAVYESRHVVELPPPPPPIPIPEPDPDAEWVVVRNTRDRLMAEFDWRYLRYDRQVRLNVTPTDDLNAMDLYMQALADITLQTDPFNIIWPTYDI